MQREKRQKLNVALICEPFQKLTSHTVSLSCGRPTSLPNPEAPTNTIVPHAVLPRTLNQHESIKHTNTVIICIYASAESEPQVLLSTRGLTCYSLAPQNMENIKRMNLNNPLKGEVVCEWHNNDKTFQRDSCESEETLHRRVDWNLDSGSRLFTERP